MDEKAATALTSAFGSFDQSPVDPSAFVQSPLGDRNQPGFLVVNGGGLGGGSSATFATIGAWNGTEWQAFSSEPNSGGLSLAVYKGKLYAGGGKLSAWDGSGWTIIAVAAGGGLSIDKLRVFDGILYGTGFFDTVGGVTGTKNAFQYDGTTIAKIGTSGTPGLGGLGRTINPYVDTSDIETLYFAGSFSTADGVSVTNVARLALPTFTDPSTDPDSPGGQDMQQFGTSFYIAGGFTTINLGATTARRIAVALGDPSTTSLTALTEDFFDGEVNELSIYRNELYAGGSFGSIHQTSLVVGGISVLKGAAWKNVATTGTDSAVFGLDRLSGPDGDVLYACGDYTTIDGNTVEGIAFWDGTQWNDLDGGFTGSGFIARDMVIWDGSI